MDITLSSRKISRFHAELDITGGRYGLTDQGSTNGTRVFRNGRWQSIRKGLVEPDERLELGDYQTTAMRLEQMATISPHGFANEQLGEPDNDERIAGPVNRNQRTGEVVAD